MHHIFNLTTLAIVGISILMGFVFKVDSFFLVKLKQNENRQRSLRLLLLAAILSFYGIISLLTLKSYYDAPRSVFSNANHHVLQNLGFSFHNAITLIDENNPSKALWDDKEGLLKLKSNGNNKTVFSAANLNTPLYFQNSQDDFELKNILVPNPIKNEIQLTWEDGIVLKLQINNKKEGKVNYSIEISDLSDSTVHVISSFHSKITKGYPIKDILKKNPIFKPAYDSVLTRIGSSLLLRSKIDDDTADLLFFPDKSLSDVKITIDNLPTNRINESSEFELEDGKYFFLGNLTSNTKKYKLESRGEEKIAYLQLPEYYYLYADDSDSLQQLFITSNTKKIVSNSSNQGFLLNGPSDENSKFHFSGSLSYYCGDTKEKMNFQFLNEEQKNVSLNEAIQFKANDTIRINPSPNLSDFGWLLKIENLKETNLFTALYYYGYIALVVVLCIVTLLLSPKLLDGKNQIIEVSVYLFLIFILSVRTILFWRASTFIPDEGMTHSVYNLFRERLFYTNFLTYQVILTGLFFTVLLISKFVYSYKKANHSPTKKKPINVFAFVVLLLSCYALNALLKFLGVEQLERIVNIYIPLVLYFLFNYLIQKRSLKTYEMVTFDSEYYVLTAINWLFCFLTFAIYDTGFTLIFAIFTLLDAYLKSTTFKDHYHTRLIPKSKIGSALWKFRQNFFSIALTLFIIFNDKILSFAFRNITMSIALGSILLFIIVWSSFQLSKKFKIYLSVGIIAFFGVSLLFKDSIATKLEENNRMLYRAEVIHKSADEIIELESFQSGNDIRILNAAQNKWIIDYYNDKSTVFPFFNNYFILQPHFQSGSSYSTQISDLVATRYIAAEHGKLIIGLILLFIGLVLVVSLHYTENYNIAAKTRISVIAFLFTIAFSIWLTSSNRLVFVGQDFPFLSLNSLLALLIGFTILGFLIISTFDKELYNPEKLSIDYHNEFLNGFRVNSGKKIFKVYLLRTILISFAIYFAKTYSSDKFDLNATITNLDEKFSSLNTLFSDYQDNNQFNSAESALQSFDSYLKSSGEFDKYFGGDTNNFYKSAYESLTLKLIKNNSPKNLVHLKKDEEGKYQFGINGFYYTTYNPDENKNGWKGNLIEQQISNSANLVSVANKKVDFSTDKQSTPVSKVVTDLLNNNIKLSYIPANWTLNNEPIFIINETFGEEKNNQSSFRIKSGGKQYTSSSNPFAFILKKGDILHIKNKISENQDLTLNFSEKTNFYLAKNVWMNGKYKFFYPQEEDFTWSYQFANFIKESTKKDDSKWKIDVPVTLDIALTEQIVDDLKLLYKENNKTKDRAASVVALTSDGSILSLADYKADVPFRFNPNKPNEFQEISEELYLNPDRMLEAKIFGNNNLLLMKPGPGSTFKPILYGSITSQYDLGWENIKLGSIDGNYPSTQDSKGNILIQHFGGKKFSLVTGSPSAEHSNYDYLLHSTNSYNAMVLFLGSLDANSLRDAFTSNKYIIRGRSSKPIENFPLIIKNGVEYRVAKDFPQWSNPKALFHQGLWLNFNLPFTSEQKNNDSTKLSQYIANGINDSYLLESKSSFKLWSQPNESHLFAIDRDLNLSNAIGNIAKGGYPIEATPLKMAEMTAHLFSMNAGVEAHVLKNFSTKTKPFSIGNWRNEDALAQFYVKNIFNTMFHVPREGTIKGLDKISRELELQGIYLYAKTGTISGGGVQDKTLTLVISKQPIHDSTRFTTAESLRRNKFIVLYFHFKKEGGGWSENALSVLRSTIRNTINSTSFKNYMP